MANTNVRKEFKVELFVSATDEKAVWTLLKQLKDVEGAGLIEEPTVDTVDGAF